MSTNHCRYIRQSLPAEVALYLNKGVQRLVTPTCNMNLGSQALSSCLGWAWKQPKAPTCTSPDINVTRTLYV